MKTTSTALAARLLLLCCLATIARAAEPTRPERSFWVWNRADPLTPAERAALRDANITRLYWQAGELELHEGELAFRRTAALPPPPQTTPEIIPVVRVSTSIRSPEQFTGDALGRALLPVVDAAPGREVQLDFDCADRLLPVYADRLRAARQTARVRRLTITALAGWADAPARAALWPAVDAVYPMLYDTRTDPAPVPGANPPAPFQPRPLLNPDELRAQLRSWSHCPIPWFAGLPVFARVTLYDADGRSRGHLRGWDWEDLVFNPALALDRPAAGGTTILRAVKPTRAGESFLPAGGFAAARGAERSEIRAGIAAADLAGARGVVFFRLPDPPSPTRATGGSWSLPQVLALLTPLPSAPPADQPRLLLRRAAEGSDRWVLRNDADADLPPRFDANARGYGLELELAGGAAGWREALPGDFHRVAGHVFVPPAAGDPRAGEKPVAVAIPLARRLTFWFAGLAAHDSLTTGLVQLAPGVDPAAVRFRLPAVDQPESTPWQSPD